ncbi:MAG: S1C family serine protease [Acidimicrobiales bacterium]
MAPRHPEVGLPVSTSSPILASPAPQTSTTAFVTAQAGSAADAQAGQVDARLSSIIDGLLPGIVAVDVAGAGGDQQGTGLVLRPDGMVLTTSALVASATTITVTAWDGQEWNASLVGTDPATGTAVISVPTSGLTVLPTDSQGEVTEGQLALVICASRQAGGPFQASVGLFSGVDKQVGLDRTASILDAIVTSATPLDAAGGFVFDDQGRVAGILQSVTSANGVTQGIATPISTVWEAAGSLMAGQEVVHAWLGVAGGQANGQAVVTAVAAASPAATAGIRPGDIVTSIDNQPITSMATLDAEVGDLQPGVTVLLGLDRAGSSLDVAATLEGQPGPGSSPPAPGS